MSTSKAEHIYGNLPQMTTEELEELWDLLSYKINERMKEERRDIDIGDDTDRSDELRESRE